MLSYNKIGLTMETVVLVIHLLVAIALVGAVLIQRSEGGGLGMGGGMSGFMTGRATANLLTRTTGMLAAAFMTTSIILALMSGGQTESRSILDTTGTTPVTSQPATPAESGEPQAPVAK